MKPAWRERIFGDAVLVEGSAARRDLLAAAAGDDESFRRALRLDPTLAVRKLEEPVFDAVDVRDVRRGVQAARRRSGTLSGSRWRPRRRFRIAAATIALAACLGVLGLLMPNQRRIPAAEEPAPRPSDLQRVTHSDVEPLGLPGARVYELAGEDFSIVLVVDESFEL